MLVLLRSLVRHSGSLVIQQKSHGFQQSASQLSVFKSAYSIDKIYPNSSLDMTKIPEPPKNEGDKFSGYIPKDKLTIKCCNSGAPGGQNVNAVNTKVDVRFHVASADWLPENIKAQITKKFNSKITKTGFLVVKSERTRSQQLNLADCLNKLRELIQEAAIVPEPPSEETLELQRRRLLQWPHMSRHPLQITVQHLGLLQRNQIAAFSQLSLCQQVQQYCTDTSGQTTVTFLSKEPDVGLMIDSYSQFGFKLNNGVNVVGPIALFPKTVLSWNVGGIEDVNEDSLALFYMLEPKIDILIIGVGDYGNKLDPKVFTFMHSKKLSLEVLSTEQACATFNFLNAEERYVAAALIPPSTLNVTDDEVVSTRIERNPLSWEIGSFL